MMNDRPIEDPKLQRALAAMRAIMARYDVAGAVLLVAPQEAAFAYKMDASWSAIQPDRVSPLGFRIRARSAAEGADRAHKRMGGAVHTICQLSDMGEQTTAWMEDLKLILRRAGVDFEHTPFGGNPLPHISDKAPE